MSTRRGPTAGGQAVATSRRRSAAVPIATPTQPIASMTTAATTSTGTAGDGATWWKAERSRTQPGASVSAPTSSRR